MSWSLSLSGTHSWGEILVSLDGLRNHSHADAYEFDALKRRLATTFSEPGRAQRVPIRFVPGTGQPVDFVLHGTAYLITEGGFDQWEVYLNLRPEGESWTVWSTDGPIRMLRQPVRGDARMTYDG